MFGFMLCEIYKLCSTQLTVVSVFNITLVAVDRYISLYIPFHYSNVVTLRLILTTVLCIWTCSSLYSVCLLYFNRLYHSTQACPGECSIIMNQALYICDLLIVFILPSATIITLYMKIFIMAKKHVVAIQAVIQPTNHQSKAPRSEHKAAKALSVVVAVFMAALLPYYISSLLYDFIDEQAFTIMVKCLSILFCFNSTINPVIYALFHPWFQKSVKLILTRQIFNPDSSLKNNTRSPPLNVVEIWRGTTSCVDVAPCRNLNFLRHNPPHLPRLGTSVPSGWVGVISLIKLGKSDLFTTFTYFICHKGQC
uniref:G-protein coupled receptors family 1 profile domain-containing protein n=1 Tax=Denticeps clupeoides TaxID=299321 RepID=A0AAY4AZF9_9TELE